MRRYITTSTGLSFVLFAWFAMAQTYGSAQSNNPPSSMTTQTTTSQATTTKLPQTSVEGCLIKEQSDFFFVPKNGNPIKLQPTSSANLSKHEGHRVNISGQEMPISAGAAANMGTGKSGGMAGTAAGTPPTSSEMNPSGSGAIGTQTGESATAAMGTATGTGNDLHKLATQEMRVTKLQHVATSCPANWNPSVPTPSSTEASPSQSY